MKKTYILCFIVLGLASCSLKSNKSTDGNIIDTEQLKEFIDDLSKNTSEFTTEQWTKLQVEYDDLMKKAEGMKDKLSDQDKKALESMKEAFTKKKDESKKLLEEFANSSSKKMKEMKKDFEVNIDKKVDEASAELENQLDAVKKEASEALEDVQRKIN